MAARALDQVRCPIASWPTQQAAERELAACVGALLPAPSKGPRSYDVAWLRQPSAWLAE